jgi:hypothetical protein
MICIKCNNRMKLILIGPKGERFNSATYRCSGRAANESFLKAI